MIDWVVGGEERDHDLPVAGGGVLGLDQALRVVIELREGWAWTKITASLKIGENLTR